MFCPLSRLSLVCWFRSYTWLCSRTGATPVPLPAPCIFGRVMFEAARRQSGKALACSDRICASEGGHPDKGVSRRRRARCTAPQGWQLYIPMRPYVALCVTMRPSAAGTSQVLTLILRVRHGQIFPDLYSKLLKAMMPLMAADCADPLCVVMRELQSSKHAAERALVVNGGNLDDDDAATPSPSVTKEPSQRAMLSGGQRAQPSRGGKKPATPASPAVPAVPASPALAGDALRSTAGAQDVNGRQVDAEAGAASSLSSSSSYGALTIGMSAVGGMGVGVLLGMLLCRK